MYCPEGVQHYFGWDIFSQKGIICDSLYENNLGLLILTVIYSYPEGCRICDSLYKETIRGLLQIMCPKTFGWPERRLCITILANES